MNKNKGGQITQSGERLSQRQVANLFSADKIITITCPCNILQYFKAVKTIISRKKVVIFFMVAQNIDCGYALEPPH